MLHSQSQRNSTCSGHRDRCVTRAHVGPVSDLFQPGKVAVDALGRTQLTTRPVRMAFRQVFLCPEFRVVLFPATRCGSERRIFVVPETSFCVAILPHSARLEKDGSLFTQWRTHGGSLTFDVPRSTSLRALSVVLANGHHGLDDFCPGKECNTWNQAPDRSRGQVHKESLTFEGQVI